MIKLIFTIIDITINGIYIILLGALALELIGKHGKKMLGK